MTTKPDHHIAFSPAFADTYRELGIATLDVALIDREALASRLSDAVPSRLAAAVPAEREILKRVERYEAFFKKFGISSPLRRQMKTTREKGLPDIDPIVRVLLLAEMATGVLMGVHDSDAMRGTITFDAAAERESFEGMRSEVRCRRGEIVARDDLGIIFSYLQGADRRTCIGPHTKSVIYFAFGVPSIPNNDLTRALSVVAEVSGGAGTVGSTAIHAPAALSPEREQPSERADPCLEPTCKNPGQFRLTRTYRTGQTLSLAACREHTDRFHELVLSVKYGDAVSALLERRGNGRVAGDGAAT